MGYYTEFDLSVYNTRMTYSYEHEHRIIEDLRKNNDYAELALDEEGNSLEGVKWYNYEQDMIIFSKKYPDNIFILEGKGEEYDDIWRHYYKDGKVAKYNAIIKFPEFDRNDLV